MCHGFCNVEVNYLNNIPRGCRQQPSLAQWQTGSSSRDEVGLEGLEGSNVIYLQLFIHARCHHVAAKREAQNIRLLSGGHWGNCSLQLTTGLELSPCSCVPPSNGEVAVYIHVCTESYNKCSHWKSASSHSAPTIIWRSISAQTINCWWLQLRVLLLLQMCFKNIFNLQPAQKIYIKSTVWRWAHRISFSKAAFDDSFPFCCGVMALKNVF